MDIPISVFALFAGMSSMLFVVSLLPKERYIPMFAVFAGAMWLAQMIFIQNIILGSTSPNIQTINAKQINSTFIANSVIYNNTQSSVSCPNDNGQCWNLQNTQTNVYFSVIGLAMMLVGALEFHINWKGGK